jgi:hypothetical protein
VSQDPLDEVVRLLEAAPHSAAALTLYALVSTLEYGKAGCLFKLDKLRDLDAPQRQLAYRLMEAMVEGKVGAPAWVEAKARMDQLVRNG